MAQIFIINCYFLKLKLLKIDNFVQGLVYKKTMRQCIIETKTEFAYSKRRRKMQKKQYQKPTIVSIVDLPDVTTLLKSSADTMYDWKDGEIEGGAF